MITDGQCDTQKSLQSRKYSFLHPIIECLKAVGFRVNLSDRHEDGLFAGGGQVAC